MISAVQNQQAAPPAAAAPRGGSGVNVPNSGGAALQILLAATQVARSIVATTGKGASLNVSA